MGYVRLLQSIAAAERRAERAQLRRQRELEKAYQNAAKARAAEAAALEVDAFNAAVETLRSLHREATSTVNWQRLADAAAPDKPRVPTVYWPEADQIRDELTNFRRTFWEWLTRSDARRVKLEASLVRSEENRSAAQAEQHARIERLHREAVADWEERCALAARILAGDTTAYGEAIEGLGGFTELVGFIGGQTLRFTFSPKRARVAFSVPEATVIPREQKTLTTKGVSLKRFPDAKRLDLYQDFVCGAALRAAREVLAAVPVDDVQVDVTGTLLNAATGHFEDALILSVLCPRERLEVVNWDHVDASECAQSLLCNMRFKKSAGFAAVTPVSPA